MAKILILIGAHLCTAPRPQKEADALAEAGHDVTVAGVHFDPKLIMRDNLLVEKKKWNFKAVLDFQSANSFTNFRTRAQKKIATEQFKKLGLFSPYLLGYGAKAMLKFALNFKADLTIVHSEAGLWVASKLLTKGLKVGVDFEDWFSEDLPPAARLGRPIAELKKLEQKLLEHCVYALATSDAMAQALSTAYKVSKPTVIYNTFPFKERQSIDKAVLDRKDKDLVSLHWFSHTIGPGRGLEVLFKALAEIRKPIEIHLRGAYPQSSQEYLEDKMPTEWRSRIYIHDSVPSTELLSRIAEHDIGLALESDAVLNQDLTVSNKLFQYMQAGLAIVATETAGQKEIMAEGAHGLVVPIADTHALSDALNSLIENPAKLAAAKQAALTAAETKYCWEKQEERLVELVEKALRKV